MKAKFLIVTISLLSSVLLISGGYGYWQKELTINGNITFKPVVPNQLVQGAQPVNAESLNIENQVVTDKAGEKYDDESIDNKLNDKKGESTEETSADQKSKVEGNADETSNNGQDIDNPTTEANVNNEGMVKDSPNTANKVKQENGSTETATNDHAENSQLPTSITGGNN